MIGNGQGGLSGPAIKPIALLKVKEVYEVAGPRGHSDHRPGRHHQRAATRSSSSSPAPRAVGVGTALFYDPLVCKSVNRGIAEYLHAHGMRSVHELVGTLQRASQQTVQCASG